MLVHIDEVVEIRYNKDQLNKDENEVLELEQNLDKGVLEDEMSAPWAEDELSAPWVEDELSAPWVEALQE